MSPRLHPTSPRRSTGVTLALACLLSLAGTPPALPAQTAHYQFREGTTNAYKVTFETVQQEVPVALGGVLLLHPTGPATSTDLTHLAISGRLTPRPHRTAPGGPPFHPRAGFGPGGPLWMPQMIMVPPGTTFSIDASGRVVRDSATWSGLPAPLDSLAHLLIEALPDTTQGAHSLDAHVTLNDELPSPTLDPNTPPYFGSHYGGRRYPQIAATRKGSARITGTTDTTLTVSNSLEWISWMTSGDSPRFSASLQRTAVFDQTLGLLRSLDISGQTTLNTPTLGIRRPLRVEVRLLEGDERKKELAAGQFTPEPPPVLDTAQLTRLLEDLESTDDSRRTSAVAQLQSAEIPHPTPALLAAAGRLVSHPDLGARMTGQRLLGLYGGTNEVPLMIRALAWGQAGGNQRPLIEGLRRLRDPRAIDALADVVARGFNEVELAADSLQLFGPAAEAAGLRLLRERHVQTRRLACTLLGQVGSAECETLLREQITDPDPQLSQVATEALRALRTRLPSPP